MKAFLYYHSPSTLERLKSSCLSHLEMNTGASRIHCTSRQAGKSLNAALKRTLPSSAFKCEPVNTLRHLVGAPDGRTATVSRHAGKPVGMRTVVESPTGHRGAITTTHSPLFVR